MADFECEALFNKSRLYIERAVSQRNSGDYEGCQLWAALAVELLGKAALASIHPSLVVDPNSPESLFAACGRPYGTQRRTIPAKAVFERLRHADRGFDNKDKEFCLNMANRRNTELHSGASPLSDMELDSWLPRYWQISKKILTLLNKSLVDWLGPEEGQGAEDIVAQVLTTVRQAVEARIEQRRNEFSSRFPSEAERERFVTEVAAGYLVSHDWFASKTYVDAVDEVTCPSCGCKSALAGEEWETIETGDHDPEEPWMHWVDTHYRAFAFKCRACELSLRDANEVQAAGFEEVFVQSDLQPVEEGEEYMNE